MTSASARSALAALLLAAVLAPAAGASPASDLSAVIKDYGPDADIASCRFTLGQLESARSALGNDINTYAPGLKTEINREITRWKDGACRNKAGAASDVRIVKVQYKGGAKQESVTLKNFGSRAVNLRGYVLSDYAKHKIRFKKTTIKAGRTLKVVTGCRKGSRGAVRKGSTYYGCRTKQFWENGGDVAGLFTSAGTLVSIKSYGTPPAAG
ncbi:MAG: hypothetical protein QOI73_1295 [Solirubrobacteraceae bacterium]|nr:hypothetical protein [Solirubrobacteraceae bacterium]